MQHKKSNALVVTLLFIIVILLGYIAFSKNIPDVIDRNVTPVNPEVFQNKDVVKNTDDTNKKIEIVQPESKTINIKLTSFNYGDNNKTFNVNKGDLIVVDSDTFTDSGYLPGDIVYDKTMLRLQSHEYIGCDNPINGPMIVGCSGSDIFKFIPIKSGITAIKRSHGQGFSTERIDLMVTLKIN
jgi:hypothetical protein